MEFNGCTRRTRTTTEPESREVDCPGCNDQAGSITVDASGNPLTASATFSSSGEWRLRILAASSESECDADDPDYTKRNVVMDCEGEINSTSYPWHGHGSDWWWVTLKQNGVLKARSECFRNPT